MFTRQTRSPVSVGSVDTKTLPIWIRFAVLLAGFCCSTVVLAQALLGGVTDIYAPASAPRRVQPYNNNDKTGGFGVVKPAADSASQGIRQDKPSLMSGITPIATTTPVNPKVDSAIFPMPALPTSPRYGAGVDSGRPKPAPRTPPNPSLADTPVIPNAWPLPPVTHIGNQITNQINTQATTSAVPRLTLPASPPDPRLVFSKPVFNGSVTSVPVEKGDFEAGQLLVLWASKETAAAGISLLQQRYQLIPSQRHDLESLGLTVILLLFSNDLEAKQWRDRLRIDQPEWVIDLNARSGPMQSAAPRLYAQKMLNGAATQLPSVMAKPSDVRLGVIDTAVDPALTRTEALNGSVIQLRNLLGPGDIPADPSHGSAVLKLIAGVAHHSGFAGAAPPAQLFWAASMRDLDGKSVTNSLVLVRALDWLVGQGVVLINMSLGGKGDAILQAVVTRVLGLNVSIVAAAGNNPTVNAPSSYPAAYPGVWAATAVDAAGQLYSGATRAPYAMLAAPGAEVWVPGSGKGNYVSGTSYASALVTATLAWQEHRFWSLSATQRAHQVCSQSRKLQDNTFLGCGLVQKHIPKSSTQPGK